MVTDIRTMLKNDMEDDKFLGGTIIKNLNISQSTLSKFVNDKGGNDLTVALKIIRYKYSDREYELMSDYIRTLKPKKKITRQSLEYASVNKLNDLFEDVLLLLEKQGNEEDKELASVYRIDWKAATGLISPFEARLELGKLDLKYEECLAYSLIAQFYAYYDQRFINEIENILPIAEESINKLEEGYIKSSFQTRLFSMTVDVKFHKGNFDEAKRIGNHALEVIKNKDTLNKINLQLGNMYLFNGFSISIDYLQKSYELAVVTGNTHRIKEAKRSINFTSNYWGENPKYLDYSSEDVSDKHEMAFYSIRNNNSEASLSILNEIDLDELNNSQLGFHYFYRALATNEKKYFYMSIKHFNLAGDRFYKQLSLVELKKLGTEDDYILDSLSF